MHILFPGAKIWPIYSRPRRHRPGSFNRRYWLGKSTRTKRPVTVKFYFNPSLVESIVNAHVDSTIRKMPDAEFLRIGFLNKMWDLSNGNTAFGFVYDIRSVKYAVSD